VRRFYKETHAGSIGRGTRQVRSVDGVVYGERPTGGTRTDTDGEESGSAHAVRPWQGDRQMMQGQRRVEVVIVQVRRRGRGRGRVRSPQWKIFAARRAAAVPTDGVRIRLFQRRKRRCYSPVSRQGTGHTTTTQHPRQGQPRPGHDDMLSLTLPPLKPTSVDVCCARNSSFAAFGKFQREPPGRRHLGRRTWPQKHKSSA
jgi:hypothetical protein